MLATVLVLLVSCWTSEAATITLAPCPDGCRCDLAASPRRVDCSRLGLITFPSPLHFSTQYLDVSFNKLSSLPDNLSVLVPQLETLLVHHNVLDTLPYNVFHDLLELRIVDVSYNLINGSLPSNLIMTNSRINSLLVSRNPSLVSFGQLKSTVLEVLDLSGCNITRLNANSFQGLPALRTLNMSLNPITVLPNNMSVTNLRQLDFTQCNLAALPSYILTGMPKLEHFHIASNPRLDLPKRPPLMSKSLLKLTADHCGIQQVQLSNLKALTHAYLSCNKISIVDRSNFAQNSALLEIDLRQNLIRELPVDVFMNAKRLVSVDLSSNNIESLQYDSFSCCDALKFLNLSRNDITQLPTILTMPTVEVLDLSRCRLISLPTNNDFLNNMSYLRQLYLHHNELQDMPKLISNSLRILDLSYCHLTHVTNETFSGLTELKRLSLAGNRLTSLNANIFDSNKKLGVLYLQDNPWRCNCSDYEFQSLYELADQLSETGRNNLTCNDPEELSGKSWEVACQIPDASESGTTAWLLSLTLFITVIALCGVLMCTKGVCGARYKTSTREARRQAREQQRRGDPLSSDDETHVHISPTDTAQCRTCSTTVRQQRRLVESQPPTYEEAVLMPRSNSVTTTSTTNVANTNIEIEPIPVIEVTEPSVGTVNSTNPSTVSDEESASASDSNADADNEQSDKETEVKNIEEQDQTDL